MIQVMKSVNLLQKSDVIDSQASKVILSNLKQKLLNQAFAIILTHLF